MTSSPRSMSRTIPLSGTRPHLQPNAKSCLVVVVHCRFVGGFQAVFEATSGDRRETHHGRFSGHIRGVPLRRQSILGVFD